MGRRPPAAGRRLPVLDAVLANGLAVHARFHDDNDISSFSHPGSLIVPPSLTLAEAEGRTLETVLRAIVAGYSARAWLGDGGRAGWTIVSRGFRGSASFGCIGAAVAASVALGLEEAQAREAVAIGADLAGGTVEPVRSGAASWRLQNGSAAWRGALAASTAREGMDGSRDALGGERGFLHAFTGLPVPDSWASPPAPELILDSWVKPYPTLGDNIGVVVAAGRIAGEIADPAAIGRVTIHQNAEFAAYPGTAYRGPFERPAQAMASTAFAVATMLVHGRISYEQYDRLDDPAILGLIEKITIVPHEDFAFVDGVVEVELGGATLTGDAADEPRTTFYRDRATARDAYAAATGDGAFADWLLAAAPATPAAEVAGTFAGAPT